MAMYEARNRAPAHSGWSVLTGVTLATASYALRRQRERDWRDASGQTKARDPAGRAADSPQEIPAQGWKDIAMRVYGRIGEDRILVIAAGTVFYGILALFPAIAALV